MSEESEYVTLISSDGYSFIIQRSSACISGAIKRMLDPSCMPNPITPTAMYPADTCLQMVSPNQKATRAALRTSSEYNRSILHVRVATY
jgi:hypothetical protein